MSLGLLPHPSVRVDNSSLQHLLQTEKWVMLPEDHSVTVQNSVLGCNFFATKINNSFTHTVGTVFTNADIQFRTSTTITIKNIPVHSGFHGPHPSPWPQAASEPISISTIANRMLFHKWSHPVWTLPSSLSHSA